MHVYIHVPFCARRCSYCDFAIAVRRTVPSNAYVASILKEWALWQNEPIWDVSPHIDTIYLGGGTPSQLTETAIARLVEGIAAVRQVPADSEITLEANPDDVQLSAAIAWRAAGVNRVSLGVQTFDPRVLQWMHRTHSADQITFAVDTLRTAGLEQVSLDLIFGLPPALARDWASDLERALALEPDHLSLYGLTVEPHTPLGRWVGRGEVLPTGEDRYAEEFLTAHQVLTDNGFEHYEVSNAGRPGHRARHNSAYWRRAPFIGLGPAAHSGFGTERRWNVREWAAYERIVQSGRSPREGRELLDQSAIDLEELYLGLRTVEGLPVSRLASSLSQAWLDAGWAELGDDRLRLTPEGWLRLDALVASVRA